MGWVNFQTLPPPLQRAVGKIEAGDVAGPLPKGTDEFLIVGLEGRRPVRAKSLAEAQPEIKRRLLPAKQQEAVQAWITGQEKKSKIEVYVEEYGLPAAAGNGRGGMQGSISLSFLFLSIPRPTAATSPS